MEKKVTLLAPRLAKRKAAALLKFTAVKLMPVLFFLFFWLNARHAELLAWFIEDIMTL